MKKQDLWAHLIFLDQKECLEEEEDFNNMICQNIPLMKELDKEEVHIKLSWKLRKKKKKNLKREKEKLKI